MIKQHMQHQSKGSYSHIKNNKEIAASSSSCKSTEKRNTTNKRKIGLRTPATKTTGAIKTPQEVRELELLLEPWP